MRVLVGFESSGAVRGAFRKLGHDAYSCDLLDADDRSEYHIKGDIFDVANDPRWDLGIFHPVCTYLTNSAAWAFGDGPYHMKIKPGTLVGAARREAREKSLAQVRWLLALPYPKAIENPRGFIGSMIKPPTQTIQPNWFGDDASKATCLWLDRLPLLIATRRLAGRFVNGVERWANQTDSGQNRLPPSADRWKKRSETYPGIAAAMADQWGNPRQQTLV